MHIHLDSVRAAIKRVGQFMELSEQHLAAILTAHDQVDPARKAIVDALVASQGLVGQLQQQLKDFPGLQATLARAGADAKILRDSLLGATKERDALKEQLAKALVGAAALTQPLQDEIAALRAHIAELEKVATVPLPAAPPAAAPAVAAAEPAAPAPVADPAPASDPAAPASPAAEDQPIAPSAQ